MTAELAPDQRETSPRFQIVRGEPTDAEVAALVAGLMVVSAEVPRPGWNRRSGWVDRSRALRTSLPPSADAWRMSLR